MGGRKYFSRKIQEIFRIPVENIPKIADGIELIVIPSQKNEEPSISVMETAGKFKFVENLMSYFDSIQLSILLKDLSKVFMLKLEIGDVNGIFSSTELDELAKKWIKNSIIIFLATKDRKRFFLYWKSKQIQQFLMLKIYDECDYMYDLRLFEFIANFLNNSLRKGHLGLHSELKIDSTTTLLHLHLLADHRNYNLLLIAAELGDIYIVHFLLDAGFSTGSHDTNAQTLAYTNRHFDIVSSLLKSNLMYPNNIRIQECPDDIKDFYEVSTSLNEAIMSRNSEKLLEILSQNQEMKHFYNLENESALAFALRHKLLDMYRLLISENVSFGPHEKFSEIKEKLKEKERVELREIHFEESKFLPDNHMHVLLSNTRFAPGTIEPKQKYEIVQKAFEILNENPFIQIILMVVAASRNFRVVFDFERDSVEHIDPTASASMKGLFYTSGRIYIAAKELLNPNTKFDALGTLAHELCHYAMNLVYKNMARPYTIEDLEGEQEFEKISTICQENHEQEEIIGFVYECYPPQVQHAELIVRVPHLIMQYFNNQDRFEEVRRIFGKLFVMFEGKIVTEIKEALPSIEAKAEVEEQKNRKKIRNLSLLSVFIGLLAMVGIIAGILITRSMFYSQTYDSKQSSVDDQKIVVPNYKFLELSADEQLVVAKAPIIYKNVDLEFCDLFPENSTVYDKLTSDHISQMLEGKSLDFNDPHLSYLNDLVTHNWPSLTRKLKQMFLNSNFTFQNESLKLRKLHKINSKVFISLTSDQIIDVLSDKKLVVHKMIKNETKFYIERKFQHAEDKNSAEIGFDQVLKLSKESLFILSAEAGTGKTVTFEQFTMRIKKKFPTQWVSYIDLKDYKALYKEVRTLQDVKKMLEKIFGLSSENEFERKIFEEFFDAGNVILLWNSFDEISPDHSEDVMRILGLIKNKTENIQYICTRPLYSGLLRLRFLSQIYTLVPFNEQEQENFVRIFLVAQKIEEIKILNYVKKFKKIAKSTRVSNVDGFDTPLMLLMISELILIDVDIYESENLYEIYQKFVKRKIEIWKEKSEFAREFSNDLLTKHRHFDMLKVYQSYAMKSEFQNSFDRHAYFYSLKLKLMRQQIPEELTIDEISRMGILYINSPRNFKFAHRTFAEFFIAQYLIENIYNANDEPLDSEAELRIQVFIYSLKYSGIRRFIESFLQRKVPNEQKNFDPQISNQLEMKFQKILLIFLKQDKRDDELFIEFIFIILNFLKKDREVLKKLLCIDKDETLYTAIISNDRLYFYSNEIKNLVTPYLTDDEFNKFIYGKNQKGVTVYSLYLWQVFYFDIDEYDQLYENIRKIKDPFEAFEKMANNLTKDEIKEFLGSKVSVQSIITFGSIRTNLTFNERIWGFVKTNFNKSDRKEILSDFFQIFPKISNKSIQGHVEFYLKKLEKYFSGDEIFKILSNFDVLYNNANSDGFKMLWDFFTNHTTRKQQKIFLRQEICESAEFGPPLNLLLTSVLRGYENTPNKIIKIYESYFNASEMQEIILLSSTDFLPYFIVEKVSPVEVIHYLRKTFIGNEKSLKEFLLRKIKSTNLNIFEFSSLFDNPVFQFSDFPNLFNNSLQ